MFGAALDCSVWSEGCKDGVRDGPTLSRARGQGPGDGTRAFMAGSQAAVPATVTRVQGISSPGMHSLRHGRYLGAGSEA